MRTLSAWLLAFSIPGPASAGAQIETRRSPETRTDTTYSFLVAGHAYGAHDGENTGLHPPLLDRLDAGVDSLAAFIILTGDIVNESTPESWQQVETELSAYPFPAYYVMGNHDDNATGHQVFEDKFGSTYYAFRRQHDLFVVLNSTEADRSIPPGQLEFLEEQIRQAGDSVRHTFIFFHEILWNSHEKYREVRSNSRSRYDQMVDHSNYWEEVHPLLAANAGMQFYIIGGDMGGNPDAMAAFYDRWDDITLLASGMGEVPDENYLLVRVNKDTSVEFEPVPLNRGLNLPGIEFFSVPPAPDAIAGPDEVVPGSTGVEYSVPEVFNATSYAWELPGGLSGSSASNRIFTDVDPAFSEGTISVRAERDGFGGGPPAVKSVKAAATSNGPGIAGENPGPVEFRLEADGLVVGVTGHAGEEIRVRIFDGLGRMWRSERVRVERAEFEIRFRSEELPEGLIFISVTSKTGQYRGKFLL